MFKQLIVIFMISACSTANKTAQVAIEKAQPKEFSKGELILGTQLLTKIFDKEMAPLECVPSVDEAALLLRTIRPRMEIVMDDMEASLDNPQAVSEMINTCDQNCTCGYVDELVREHLVPLSKTQRKNLNAKKTDKELNRCLNFVQTTFCQGELYKTLDLEKEDFSFEEGT